MKYSYTLLITFLMLAAVPLSAQEGGLKKGNEEFKEYAFIDARKAYLKVAEEGFLSEDLLERLGDSYYYTADYINAAKWYGALYDFSENVKPEYLYRYALSLKSNRQYDASDRIMEEFFTAKGNDYRANLFVKERNYLSEIEMQSGRFELINIGFNSTLSDFAPAFNQGHLVFASNRMEGKFTKRVHDWNEQPFLDLYKVSIGENDVESGVQKLDDDLNTKFHESTATFSKDGQTIYFTRNNYTEGDYKQDNEGTNRLKLYKGKKTENGWKITELPFNSDQYSVAHPTLSKDGKTLYFSSDMPGTIGLSDLYKVSIDGDSYGTPVNLGEKINTEGRETFPFISTEGKMYFSSDGHIGLGGLDVFVADLKEDASFGNVFNVGRPINSPVDDFTFIINGTTGIGYFASNREGGVGDDDIYSFNRIQPLITSCSQQLEGVVLDQATDKPLSSAKVVLLNSTNDVIAEATSGANGNFNFSLNCGMQYSIRSSKDGYSTAEKSFVTSNDMNKTIEKTLYLKKGSDLGITSAGIGSDLAKVLGLNPIYFDLDKDAIRPDAEIELRKIIAVMITYPDMKIDIRSHTDSRADDSYNIKLSERRAQSTLSYLVSKGGIDKSRLSGKGYGETQLTNGCITGAACSEAAHQLNRRSEFIIMR
jgi:outer membrane protein OmpA-like peptidoglycan-associated protein